MFRIFGKLLLQCTHDKHYLFYKTIYHFTHSGGLTFLQTSINRLWLRVTLFCVKVGKDRHHKYKHIYIHEYNSVKVVQVAKNSDYRIMKVM